MNAHVDKGRYLISVAILKSDLNISATLRAKAFECVLAYQGEPLLNYN